MLEIGQKMSSSKTYSRNMVEQFAELSGDKNPIHLNDEFAQKSIFQKPIVHGILVLGQISELLANKLPGEGTIYLEQNAKFLKPVYHGDSITCNVEITEIITEKARVKLSTQCYNSSNEIVVDGFAWVKIPKDKI